MKTNFGRGTIYHLSDGRRLAEVYYFIQGAPPEDAVKENQGFLEPIVEYEHVPDVLRHSPKLMLEIQDGSRLVITVEENLSLGHNPLPLFFRTGLRKGPASAGAARSGKAVENCSAVHS